MPWDVDVQELDLAVGKLVRQRAGLERPGVVEVGAPVERRDGQEPDGQHVAGFGALDADRPDDRVRSLARILHAPLGKLRDADASLESVEEMRPRVGVDDGIAGVDLDDIRARGVEDTEPDRF